MKILNTVPYINQMPKWPTGCESVSTVMLLDYCGISIGVDELDLSIKAIDISGLSTANMAERYVKCGT